MLNHNLFAITAFALASAVGCKPRGVAAVSGVKVTNGIDTDDYPAVVMLVNAEEATVCTGTFVTSATLLTAAHCLGHDKSGSLLFGDTPSIAAYFTGAVGEEAALKPTDLAIVLFPPETAPAIQPLASTAAAAGDAVTLVGYGRSIARRSETSGDKRFGTNRLEKIEGGFLQLTGVAAATAGVAPGERAASAKGDSGGPLLIDGAIVGVDSGGATDGANLKHSRYVDLFSPMSCATLADAAATGCPLPDMTRSPCGKAMPVPPQ